MLDQMEKFIILTSREFSDFTPRFRVSRPIRLTHVGFFGPVAENSGQQLIPPAFVGGHGGQVGSALSLPALGGSNCEGSSSAASGSETPPRSGNGAPDNAQSDGEPTSNGIDGLLAYVQLSIRESRFNDTTKPDADLRVFFPNRVYLVDVQAFRGGRVFVVELPNDGVALPSGLFFDVGFQLQVRFVTNEYLTVLH